MLLPMTSNELLEVLVVVLVQTPGSDEKQTRATPPQDPHAVQGHIEDDEEEGKEVAKSPHGPGKAERGEGEVEEAVPEVVSCIHEDGSKLHACGVVKLEVVVVLEDGVHGIVHGVVSEVHVEVVVVLRDGVHGVVHGAVKEVHVDVEAEVIVVDVVDADCAELLVATASSSSCGSRQMPRSSPSRARCMPSGTDESDTSMSSSSLSAGNRQMSRPKASAPIV